MSYIGDTGIELTSSEIELIANLLALATSSSTQAIRKTSATGFANVEVDTSSTTNVDGEVVSGSGTTFTLAHTPTAGTVHVYGYGQRLSVSAGDYTISGAVITMTNSFDSGSVLADYNY